MTESSPETGGPAPTQSKDIVVFMVRRDTKCAECGRDLLDGDLLQVEQERALCLDCAGASGVSWRRQHGIDAARHETFPIARGSGALGAGAETL